MMEAFTSLVRRQWRDLERLVEPTSLASGAARPNLIYITDIFCCAVIVFNTGDGSFVWDIGADGPYKLVKPISVAVDFDEMVLVLDVG